VQAGIKKLIAIIGTSLLSITGITIGYSKISTKAFEQSNRHEQYAPEEYNVPVTSLNGYSKIYENEHFEYYYNSSNSILRFRNKISGFVWSTGAGTYTKQEASSLSAGVTAETASNYPIDAGPNSAGGTSDIYYSEINQLLAFTYIDTADTSRKTYTLSSEATSYFYRHKDYDNEFMYKLSYRIMDSTGEKNLYDFEINMRLTFNEDGFDVNIYDEDIGGEDSDNIESIMPLPRLGQSGGKQIACTIGDDGNCEWNVENVTKKYGKNLACNDVSFHLNPGDMTILLGPNGAGKSTIMKSIMGFLKYQGAIKVDGLVNKSVEAKRVLGFVPEMPALYPNLTVSEHLEFIARAYKLTDYKDRIEDLLTRFELDDKRKKFGDELSKGMQQKLNLCIGLLPNPKVLLLDEPMIGLDPHAIKELKKIINEMRSQGKTLLVSTHIIDSVDMMWDRTIIMQNGTVKANVTKSELETNGQTLEDLFFAVTEGITKDSVQSEETIDAGNTSSDTVNDEKKEEA